MPLTYQHYPFTPILGWSISRYEAFDKCKRQYFYNYYSKFIPDIPQYKIKQLKAMTSVPLEIGNVVHDIIEVFLRRLQKSDSNIDENRFFVFAREKAEKAFSEKTFIEHYYASERTVSADDAYDKITTCLKNFIGSPCYSWIFMKAIRNKNDWLIEPPGYGETRLNGLKAYCKMDFLFPVDDEVHILDWKTGSRDTYKHSNQLSGYAAAAHNNFNIPWNMIFPKIVYLYPEFDEFECNLSKDNTDFFQKVQEQTDEMYAFCSDVANNMPLPMKHFPKTPSQGMCSYCNYQELCFPAKKGASAITESTF